MLALAALALILAASQTNTAPGLWGQLGAWRLTTPQGHSGGNWQRVADQDLRVQATPTGHEVRDSARHVVLQAAHTRLTDDVLDLETDGLRRCISVARTAHQITLSERLQTTTFPCGAQAGANAAVQAGTDITAPMPGLLVELLHPRGASLKQGDPVLVFEAMKLMQTLVAPCDGILTDLPHPAGATVSGGTLLARFSPDQITPDKDTQP